MEKKDLNRIVQVALLGEVPPSLRFLYVYLQNGTLNFRAVFDSTATDEHLESASRVCTEVVAACPWDTKLNEEIKIDDVAPWKIGNGENLMFLRYGEFSDT